MELDSKKVCIISFLISIIIFVSMLAYMWHFTVDDAFISFNYSKHLVNGLGLVWNIGQSPVEGYTNFLWVLMIAFGLLFKLDPVFLTKILGLSSVFGILIIFWFITKDMFKDKNKQLIAFVVSSIFFLVNPYTAIHAVSGLETMFYAFLLLGAVYSAWKIILSFNLKFIWIFAFTSLLLSLTRPEGTLISLGLILTIIYISYKNNNSIKLNQFIPILILYLTPITIYMVFSISYFHELFPLSFISKVTHGNTYPGYFLLALIYLIPFVFMILFSLYTKNQRIEKHENQQKACFKYFLLILGVAIFFADIAYVNTPDINFGQRYFYPSFVLVYMAFGIAFTMLFNEIRNISSKTENALKIFASAVILALLVFSCFNSMSDFNFNYDYGINLNNAHIPLGKSLDTFAADDYTVYCGDAGSIAYYSGWNLLDALNDKYIAQNGVTLGYLKQMHPELVIIISSYKTINWDSQSPAVKDYILKNNFTQLDSIKFNNNYYLIPFLKPNIKDYESIKNSIETVSKGSNK